MEGRKETLTLYLPQQQVRQSVVCAVLCCEQRGPIDCDTSFFTLNALEKRYNVIAVTHAAVQATGSFVQHMRSNQIYPSIT